MKIFKTYLSVICFPLLTVLFMLAIYSLLVSPFLESTTKATESKVSEKMKARGKENLSEFAAKAVVRATYETGRIAMYALEEECNEESTKDFLKNHIMPAKTFVDTFRLKNNRLPTKKEFFDWDIKGRFVYYPKKPDYELKCGWGKEGSAYIIGAWTGERYRFYCSWNGKSFTDSEGL